MFIQATGQTFCHTSAYRLSALGKLGPLAQAGSFPFLKEPVQKQKLGR